MQPKEMIYISSRIKSVSRERRYITKATAIPTVIDSMVFFVILKELVLFNEVRSSDCDIARYKVYICSI
jgi:hypothetical protein